MGMPIYSFSSSKSLAILVRKQKLRLLVEAMLVRKQKIRLLVEIFHTLAVYTEKV